MLIAIMSDTQSKRTGLAKEIKFKTRLKFVLDYWYFISNERYSNPRFIAENKFIVTAFQANSVQEDEQSAQLHQLGSRLENSSMKFGRTNQV